MILDILLTILSMLVNIVAWILPNWRLPEFLITPFETTFTWMFGLFPPIAEPLFGCLLLIIGFEAAFWLSHLTISIVNWFRGSGELKI